MRRNPIVNAPDRVSYFTNNGTPYSTIDNATDVANMDLLAQPRDNNFLNKDASGTVVTGNHIMGRGTPADPNAKNLLWDNTEGDQHWNTGQGIGLVKNTNMPMNHQGYVPHLQDQPFIQYGGTAMAVGGRRLNGSNPGIWNRQLSMRDTVTVVNEYELVDPRNPFNARVSGRRNVSQYFPQEITDVMIQPGQSHKFSRHQVIPMDRGWAAPALPINDDINIFPYTDPDLSMTHPFIQGITMVDNLLSLSITAAIQNAGPGTTYDVVWGNGTTSAATASGGTVTTTYATSGVYDVSIRNSANPQDIKTYRMFMRDATWTPVPLSFDPAFVANVSPFTVTAGRRLTLTAPLRVNGDPSIHLFVDFGDNTGSLQEHHAFRPTTEELTHSTFTFDHTYKYPGSYMVRIFAEHLIDDMAGTPTGQQRNQIMILKPVRVD